MSKHIKYKKVTTLHQICSFVLQTVLPSKETQNHLWQVGSASWTSTMQISLWRVAFIHRVNCCFFSISHN